MSLIRRMALNVETIGPGAMLRYRAARFRDKLDNALGRNKPVCTPIPLTLKGYRFPIWMRRGTSDIHVFHQVFLDKQYEFPIGIERDRVGLVVDCGANVGYTSVFMLKKFPNAHVIALEPDPDNFEICRKNLEPYGSRVELIRRGVWSREVSLKIVRPEGPEFEWGIYLVEAAPDEAPDVRTTTISAILERSGLPAIDLLKIDVEGAEEVIFAEDCHWLARVKNIAIELHGEAPGRRTSTACAEAFFRAMDGYRYDLGASGEHTVCSNITPCNPPPASEGRERRIAALVSEARKEKLRLSQKA
jgi:FkbM family methyltransferase